MSSSTDEDLIDLCDRIGSMSQLGAVDGKEISDPTGSLVVEQTTTTGDVVAVKVRAPRGEVEHIETEHGEYKVVQHPPSYVVERSEAEMTAPQAESASSHEPWNLQPGRLVKLLVPMHYAAINGILAPKVLGTYEVMSIEPDKPTALAMVSERVPGEILYHVWRDLSDDQKSSVKQQLRTQLARMRSCTQPFIGRIGKKPTRNIYEPLGSNTCGPFVDEKEFDEWCLARLHHGSFSQWKWRRWLERQRRRSSGVFVLTHGDLSPRNIMIQDGIVTGLVDWERSGFYPEYAEYAFAMRLSYGFPDWWIPVLQDILQPYPKGRLEFTSLIEDRFHCGWHSSRIYR